MYGNTTACAGLATGQACPPSCNANYQFITVPNTSAAIVCNYGQWIIKGYCLSNALAVNGHSSHVVVPSVVAQIHLSAGRRLAQQTEGRALQAAGTPQLGYEWASANAGVFAPAYAKALGVALSQVLVDVVLASSLNPSSGGRIRRLSNETTQAHSQGASEAIVSALQSSSAPSRSLQQNVSSAFGLDLHVLLDGVSAGAAASEGATQVQKINALVANPGAMSNAMKAELVLQGKALPQGLDAMTAQLTAPPFYVVDFVAPSTIWHSGSWSECSTGCGHGLQTRYVGCPRSALPGVCDGAKPTAEQICTDWRDCEPSFMCPFAGMSRLSDPLCEVQGGLVIGMICLIALCFCCLCFRKIQMKNRTPKEDFTNIRNDGTNANARSQWSVDEAGANSRIIWEAAEVGNREKDIEVAEPGSSDVENEAIAPALNIRIAGVLPYYRDDSVEYFSQSNQYWVRGQILEERMGVSGSLTYTVIVGQSKQVRSLVPLTSLRNGFVKYELCEILSERLDEWNPGIIAADPTKYPTMQGYVARLLSEEGEPKDIVRVSANRVRRRFPVGSNVEVYHDEENGWIKATVIKSGAAKTNVRDPDHSRRMITRTVELSRMDDVDENSEGEQVVASTTSVRPEVELVVVDEHGRSGVIPLWAKVTIRTSWWAGQACPAGEPFVKTVSSHLLRFCDGDIVRIAGTSVADDDEESDMNLSDLQSDMSM
jgi:hypothetical protein